MIKLILIKDLPATYNRNGAGSDGESGGESGFGYDNGNGCGWDNGSGIG